MGDSSGHHVPALSSQSGATRMKEELSDVLRKETILRRREKGAKIKTPSGQACQVSGQALEEGPLATLNLPEENRSTWGVNKAEQTA